MSPSDDPARYLFIGDSITDAGRTWSSDNPLGDGYVRELDRRFTIAGLPVRTLNTGIGGHRVVDLRRRWAEDALDLRPTLLSVLVGVNDTWRRYDSDDPTSVTAYADDYDAMLSAVDRDVTKTIVLIEPFLVPLSEEQREWRDDLDPKIAAVRALAVEHGAILVPADGGLNRAGVEHGPEAIAFDGAHPTPLGHRLLAQLWLDAVAITA